MFGPLPEVMGVPVIALAEGRVMGSVYRAYINPSKKNISGLLIKEPRFVSHGSWIDASDLALIGADVIFINRASSCKAKSPVGRSLKDMMGMPVASLDGRLLGSLVDVVIDRKWRLASLYLSERKTVPFDLSRSIIGRDALLLPAGTSVTVQPAEFQADGLLGRLFGPDIVEVIARAIGRSEKEALPLSRQAAARRRAARRQNPTGC